MEWLAGWHPLVHSEGQLELPAQHSRDNEFYTFDGNVLYGTVRERSDTFMPLPEQSIREYSTVQEPISLGWAMENNVKVTDYQKREAGSPEGGASEVQRALSEILKSAPFHSSKQSQELLQYIVDQTLAGHFEMLKERIVGANVFNRSPDYDTNDDPIVRARAAEVRKRLALYYQTARDESVRISIPSGSFRAIFDWIGTNPVPLPPVLPHESERSQPPIEPITPPASQEVAAPSPTQTTSRLRGLRWWISRLPLWRS